MKKWYLKAIVQKIVSWLPFSVAINYWLQKNITGGVLLNDEYFYDRLQHAQVHTTNFFKYSTQPLHTTLELGTGWYPVVPLAMFLCGAQKIYTVDITPLTNRAHLHTTIKKFIEVISKNELQNLLPYVLPIRCDELKKINQEFESLTTEEILNRLHFQYIVQDARHLPFPDGTIDLLHSNNTLEHIDAAILPAILQEQKRIIHPQGFISQAIDMSDHFAHFDTGISIYNYLKFTASQWKMIDNNLQPQNRLRMIDYENQFATAGLPIVTKTFRKGNVEQVKNIKLAAPYATMPVDDVAISHCYLGVKF